MSDKLREEIIKLCLHYWPMGNREAVEKRMDKIGITSALLAAGDEIEELKRTLEATTYTLSKEQDRSKILQERYLHFQQALTKAKAERERLREAIQEAIRRGKTGDMSYGIGTILTEALYNQPKEESNEKT